MSGICKAKARRHAKSKTKYEVVQPRRTEQNRAKRAKRLQKGRENAVAKEPRPTLQRQESIATRAERHQAHQEMLKEHESKKSIARERHRKH